MKSCPVCALDMEDTYLFCPDDGSILRAGSNESFASAAIASELPVESKDEPAAALVLYCPTCASEYPLTFSECPMHGVPLTRRHLPRFSNKDRAAAVEAPSQAPDAGLADQPTHLDLTRSQIERPQQPAEPANASRAGVDPPLAAFATGEDNGAKSDYPELLTEVSEQRLERPGFRVAAIATVIALALLAVAATYGLVSNLSRRPSPPVMRVASAADAAPESSLFIPTPQEARDYKDEQPAPVASQPAPQVEQPQRKGNEAVSASTTERNARNSIAQPDPTREAVRPQQLPATPTRGSAAPMPALPRGNTGGFDARLIRVRSRRTPSGVRYDLTFNIQEQANRAAQWQRVLIATRSASGANHSEAIPFVHRLGATGALTFTISVELTGRSEADWQGRVVCTTLGWDNKGAPLQASFGANLTP